MPTFLEAILNAWWQGILLTFLVWLALREQTRISAATRLAIWQVTLAVILALPLLQWIPTLNPPAKVRVQAQVPPQTQAELPPLPQPAPQPLVDLEAHDVVEPFFIIAVLLAGVQMLRLLAGYFAIWRLKRKSIPCQAPLPRALTRDARILIHPRIGMPMAVGYFNPAIILPERMIQALSPDQIEQVVLHEAAHLERKDDWFGLLERLLRAIFFIQPAVWFIGKQIDKEREWACDDWVVARSGETKPYAEALARVAEVGSLGWTPILATGVGRRKQIFERMEALLDQTRNKIPSASGPLVLAAALMLVFVVIQSTPVSRLFGFSQFDTRSVIRDDKSSREFSIRGDIQFTADEQDVESLSPGAKLHLIHNETWIARRIEMEADENGKITRRYFVGGIAQPYGSEAKRFLAKELPQWMKNQPKDLDARLARWIETEGVEGALRQIEGSFNSGIRRQYLDALLRTATLDPVQTRRLIRISEQLPSDEDKAHIAALMRDQSRSTGLESALIDLIHSIHDEDRRGDLLRRLLSDVGDATLPRLLRAMGEIHSEDRKADLLVDASREIRRELPLAFFEAARGIHSEDHRQRVIQSAIEHHGAEVRTQQKALELAAEIHSLDRMRHVATLLLEQPQVAPETLEQVKQFAAKMPSKEDSEAILKQLNSR